MFIRPEIFDEVKNVIQKGMFLKIKGVTTIDKFDGELTLGSIVGIKKGEDFTSKRMDTSIAAAAVKAEAHTESSTAINDEVQSSISRKAGPAAIQETIFFPCS